MHTCNGDLVWNVGSRRYNENIVRFLRRFENTICLFSGSVNQLYSNYEIHPVKSAPNRLVALPNQYSYHDTFFNVRPDAVRPTGLFIVPDEAANEEGTKGLRLVYRSKKTKKFKSLPLDKGMSQVKKLYEKEGNFLPVIVNRDLRFRKNNHPIMHLHRLDTNALSGVSRFQARDIETTIEDKLDSLTRLAAN